MNNIFNSLSQGPWFYVIAIWSLIWKGLALWRAARNDHKIWYVVLLVLNILGIPEILYYFVFSKKGEVKKSTSVTSVQ